MICISVLLTSANAFTFTQENKLASNAISESL